MEHAEPNAETVFNEMTAVIEMSRGVRGTVGALRQCLWQNVVADDVFPRSLPVEVESLFSSLHQEIEAIERASSKALDRCRDLPVHLALKGRMLSREQYHLLAATGFAITSAESIGLSEVDDYEIFALFCYEDDERFCYINPLEKPRSPGEGIKIRFGVPPEELSVGNLRPEQVSFFEKRLPHILARFRDARPEPAREGPD
ncbi:MAG TPA: hypothetical protein VNY05_04655 [Candidatus Acidoferrales bacterium]|jgi:hypothetical protein|nr:hypothetical protein [Candidatus Acidoferrales bacterium]